MSCSRSNSQYVAPLAATNGTKKTRTRAKRSSVSRNIEIARVAPCAIASRTRTCTPRARAIPTVIRHACPYMVNPRVAATSSSRAASPDFVVKKKNAMSASVTALLPEREMSIRSNTSDVGVITTNASRATTTSIPMSVLQSRIKARAAPAIVASAPNGLTPASLASARSAIRPSRPSHSISVDSIDSFAPAHLGLSACPSMSLNPQWAPIAERLYLTR